MPHRSLVASVARSPAVSSARTSRGAPGGAVHGPRGAGDTIAAGMPPFYADMLLGTFRAARRGDFAATDPLPQTLLRRPPWTMSEILAAWLR